MNYEHISTYLEEGQEVVKLLPCCASIKEHATRLKDGCCETDTEVVIG